MKPAINLINPCICPCCGSTFTLVSTITNRTPLDQHGRIDNNELYYKQMSCMDPDEYLVCNNDTCGAIFEAKFSPDETHSIATLVKIDKEVIK